ncbi:hypothetical protein [Enteractinococcus coprophilus]|nr:hypothetical protein [Enteractinococcus coprophilus]
MTQPLPDWASNLLSALEIESVQVDIATLRHIADAIDHDEQTDKLVVGFIAGYAAGIAQGTGMAGFDKAHAASVSFMAKSLGTE